MSPRSPETEIGVSIKSHDEIKEPSMFRVWLHNDDFTTMDFVVEILMAVFKKSPDEAAHIMFNVHKQGVGLCGIFTHEVAETKVDTVHSLAQENGFPLKCSMEKE